MQDTGTATRLYMYEANGNVGQLVDGSTGVVVAHYEYDPFGTTLTASGTAATANPFRFSTKYIDDETTLVYYGYRFYSPYLGRWLTRDPIEEAGGANLFAYVKNNSLTNYDALGLWVELDKIRPPEEAFTTIEDALRNVENALANVDSVQYKAIHWVGSHDLYRDNSPRMQKYLDSFLVAAQAVKPSWVGNNKFVFTCKYGWIDVGHFFATALMAFATGNANIRSPEIVANYPYLVTTGVIEGYQTAIRWTGNILWALRIPGGDIRLSPTAQSGGAAEDYGSNWQGALFASKILVELAGGGHTDVEPSENILLRWDEFLYNSQAIAFNESDEIYKILRKDAASFWANLDGKGVYNGPRLSGWSELKKQSYAYCRLCNGDRPKPNVPTYSRRLR